MEKRFKDLNRIEICAYKDLGIPCGQRIFCNGYDLSCPMYTTYGHLAEFNEIFDLPNNEDYESYCEMAREEEDCMSALEKIYKIRGEDWTR